VIHNILRRGLARRPLHQSQSQQASIEVDIALRSSSRTVQELFRTQYPIPDNDHGWRC
jgi:hypothetical protein